MTRAAPAHGVTGIVLAGGLGKRMSADGKGIDKGLQPLGGRALVEHVLERLAPQVDTILINANRNAGRYATFGYPIVPDALAGFAGPLAGLHAGLLAATTPWVVIVPCDSPFLPGDLVARLLDAATRAGSPIAVVRTGNQPQPVFALVHRRLAASLAHYLAAGDRKIDLWYAPLGVVEVPFEDAAAFRNINTRDELAQCEQGPQP